MHNPEPYSHMLSGDLTQQEHMKKLKEKFQDIRTDIEKT